MFKFLNSIEPKLYKRYLTVEKNIEAKSNSFYDSWLDLAEHFSKFVAKKEDITIDAKYDTMIGILSQKEYEMFYRGIGISKQDYEDLFDLAKNVNAHKHRDETNVALTDVIKHLKAFYNYASLYFKARCEGKITAFNENYIVDLFGKTEREKKRLLEEKEELIESLTNLTEGKEILSRDLERVKAIAKRKESETDSLEEEKELLFKEVNELKDIKLTTLEEKVARIVAILERQTYALEKVGNQLEYASSINFGQPHEHSVTIGGGYESSPRLQGYDRYIALKICKQMNEKKFLDFLKENEGKEFKLDSAYCTFTYKLKKNDVHFDCKNGKRALEKFDLPIQMILFNLGEFLEHRRTAQAGVVLALGKASGCYPFKPREDELVEVFLNR